VFKVSEVVAVLQCMIHRTTKTGEGEDSYNGRRHVKGDHVADPQSRWGYNRKDSGFIISEGMFEKNWAATGVM
jgi:hypothetical protein